MTNSIDSQPAFPSEHVPGDNAALCNTRNAFEIIPIPAFNDNYIWLLMAPQAPATGTSSVSVRDVIVVDPGQAQPVIDVLEARGLRLSAILLTHHHNDHVGGVAALLAHANPAAGAVPVYGPAGEDIAHVTTKLSGGDSVEVSSPSAHFTVIDVPGHTRGHIAFFASAPEQGESEQGQAQPPRVFCGDTLFATGCGRLFEGTPAQMLVSLDRLAVLPPTTHVYCAHEYTLSNIRFALACDADNADLHRWQADAEALRQQGKPTVPTTLAHELRVNPFLRPDEPAILARLTRELGHTPQTRLQAFTALREWKDRF